MVTRKYAMTVERKPMKIKEISASLSGVIPIASYTNLRPSYSITAEIDEKEDVDKAMTDIKNIIRGHFVQEENRAKTDLLEKEYANLRFREINGKKYPSVTSILNWDIDWKISEDELQQYASRGTIVHSLIETFFKENKWQDPIDMPELEKDVSILMTGSKKLSWNQCSHQKAIENIVKDIKIIEQEKTVHNEEHLYSGRLDTLCQYKGKLTVMDFKTGTTADMRQLAAYSACLDKIEQLVIVPVGPTDNKSGFKKPIICDDIEKEFKAFLCARTKFRKRFGV